MTDTKRYWFGPKRIGVGISPRSWQGWLVMAIYALAIIALSRAFPVATHRTDFWIGLAAASLVLVGIMLATYGPRTPPARR